MLKIVKKEQNYQNPVFIILLFLDEHYILILYVTKINSDNMFS